MIHFGENNKSFHHSGVTKSTLDNALLVKSDMTAIQGHTIYRYDFRQNRSRFMILMSTIGFSDIP